MITSMRIEADMEIELPALPNFIKRTDGGSIDIADLSTASINTLAANWRDALHIHAEDRRKGPKLKGK